MPKLRLGDLMSAAATNLTCKDCGSCFEGATVHDARAAFTRHRCPAVPEAKPDESAERWETRVREHGRAWRAAHGVPEPSDDGASARLDAIVHGIVDRDAARAAVGCPRCGASAGVDCRTPTGFYAKPHRERIATYHARNDA